jgi:hypothetical protein
MQILLQQPVWITRRLERVPKVRKLHQPESMLQVCLAADVKGNPAEIGNPVVLLGETPGQERIAYRAGERNMYYLPQDGCAQLLRPNRNSRPPKRCG